MQELVAKRTRTAKLYQLDEGGAQGVFKTGPVHWLSGSVWEEFDLRWAEVSSGLWAPTASDLGATLQGDTVSFVTAKGHTLSYQVPQRLSTTLLDDNTIRVEHDLGHIDVFCCNLGVKQSITVLTNKNTTWTLTYPTTLSTGGTLVAVNSRLVEARWADETVRFTVDAVTGADGLRYETVSLSVYQGNLRLTVNDRGIPAPYLVRCPDTFLSTSADGAIYAEYVTPYATCADMATNVSVMANAVIGQAPSTNYYVYQSFVLFDTSTLVGYIISAATLGLYMKTDTSTTDFTVQARAHTWGATLATGDAVADHNLAAKTLLATKSTNPTWSTVAYTDLTSEAAFPAAVNTTGTTDIILVSAEQVGNPGSAPTDFEYVNIGLFEDVGKEPRLVVTGTPPVTYGLRVTRHI